MAETFTSWAPASLSNLGPGFDSIGVALTCWGDEVSVTLKNDPGVTVSFDRSGVWSGPTDPDQNTASIAAVEVANLAGYRDGISISIKKGIRAGSGLGSSAASAVAGAMATNCALGSPFSKRELIPAILKGESIVSGALHGDNVIPSLIGGVIVTLANDPADFRKIEVPSEIHLAIIHPGVEVLTLEAREILPREIPLHSAAVWASRFAHLIDSLHRGDIQALGAAVMTDEIVEPVRASLFAPYRAIKAAALSAGAAGCALTGSGPAMFAVCSTHAQAKLVGERMQETCRHEGLDSLIIADRINKRGAVMR